MRRLIFIWCVIFASGNIHAADSRIAVNAELGKQEVRGGIVYKSYCVLCHGETGDGSSRASKLYGRELLAIKPAARADYVNIIRYGGAAMGKSAYMPVWQDELSEEQIGDVVVYLNILRESARRGEVVYKSNCILCHGINGNGKGRAAKLYHPPPSDLTHSDKNDDYKEMIIRLGGEAMGRSAVMPAWGGQLSDTEIHDAVAYLRTILVTYRKY